jgi:DNA polymerase III psi subunit
MMRLPTWWARDRRRSHGCPACGHEVETLRCACDRPDCICRSAGKARFEAIVSTLSPRDQQWLLSQREVVASAFALGDWSQTRRIMARQVAEAEDPAAVERVLRAFGEGPSENFVLTASRIAHLEAVTRQGLAGRSIVEIEDLREKARDAYRQACAEAGGDHDHVMVRTAELRLSVCSSVLRWMQTTGLDHYDGGPLGDDT